MFFQVFSRPPLADTRKGWPYEFLYRILTLMKLGIKVGPQKQSIDDLDHTNAPFAEVWFQIDKKDDYNELFSYLTNKRIDTGLHFWGLTHRGFMPSLAHDDPLLIKESVALIRQTIDVASEHHFSYVNIHPGTRTKVVMDFEKETFTPKSDPTSVARGQTLFLEHVLELSSYAKTKNVVLTVETVNINVTNHWRADAAASRLHPFSLHELPIETLLLAGTQGVALANDFGHTASTIISDSAQEVWSHLKTKTKELFPYTRLLHIGFIMSPYNGTDFHDHLDNPIFETSEAVPNKNQMIELLKLFKNQSDVWALAEPNGQHSKNYFIAQKILTKAGL